MFLTLASFLGTKPLQKTGWYVHVRNGCPSPLLESTGEKNGEKSKR